jgi:hypothetical protein
MALGAPAGPLKLAFPGHLSCLGTQVREAWQTLALRRYRGRIACWHRTGVVRRDKWDGLSVGWSIVPQSLELEAAAHGGRPALGLRPRSACQRCGPHRSAAECGTTMEARHK